jgi:AraC-like DNA-binding protein
MDTVQPPYPHFSWLAYWLIIEPPRVFAVHKSHHVTHQLVLTTSGAADISWETRSTETAFRATSGDIGFFPCDRREHTLSITAAGDFSAYTVLLPAGHVQRVCGEEGLNPALNLPAIPSFRDGLMQASLVRLSSRTEGRQISEDIGDEIAARQIVLRLCVLVGGSVPEWQKDTSVFTPVVMRQVVASIDAHLGVPLTLECMARTAGLSPGHFARKFHQSSGESLGRFINRRRVATSFAMLRAGGLSLAGIALELGFSSQSHFTRLFSGLSGITPDQFRRLYRRTSG